ncbi:hypothetical protein Ahy_A09g044210 [Arachis hypogaea]|uniref:SET domain-containing protein n=1 Tax=Arachis hypogaea TaxID=3818 RepID=A0A445BJR2_ARAHY|nr:hypothetical protein Ahy_A09g044210 [Arachis hypogaea]
MAPNRRVTNAYNAMRILGISDDEVMPVLKRLLKVYGNSWELIEEDNYQTLIHAYFESMEYQQEKGKGKAPISNHDGERARLKLQMISVVDNEILSKTSKKKIIKPSQASKEDMKLANSSQPLQTRLSEVEIISSLSCMDARDSKKLCHENAASARDCGDSFDGSSRSHIQKIHMSSNRYEKELIILKAKKPKLHLEPVSSHLKGPCDDSNVNHRFKFISALYQNGPNPNHANLSNMVQQAIVHPEYNSAGPCDDSNTNRHFKSISSLYQNGPNLNHANLTNMVQQAVVHPEHNSRGPCDDSNVNCRFKSISTLYQYGPNLNHANLTKIAQKAIVHAENSSIQILSDITKGSEKVAISLLDETGSEELPKFNYIPNNIIYQNANVNISLARVADEDCCSDCSGNCLSLTFPCACSQETGGEFAYTREGLVKEKFLEACIATKIKPQPYHFVYCQECPIYKGSEHMPEECKGHLVRKFIKECWRKCGCDMQCGNRVVQRGLRCKLQVFLTQEGKGWGIRTLEDLPKGCFVCEYVGEILTNAELYERVLHKSSKDRHTYPVTLDADWGSERVLKDDEALCLDATYNGNIARFINHRCFDANLIDIPVEVEIPDRHYYHIALFTNRKVKAYKELTWDYGIDFDDQEHPIKAFQCCCGSTFCRDKKKKGLLHNLLLYLCYAMSEFDLSSLFNVTHA